MAEDSLADEYKGKGDTEPVLWWPQTIRNACGLMGLLHAVSNGNARNFIGMFICWGKRMRLMSGRGGFHA